MLRKQFPVFPAEAITIHKSKGATFESEAVHMCKGMSNSLKYVAMSRCTKAEGLYIVGEINFESLTNRKVSKNVYEEIKRLETIPVQFELRYLYEQPKIRSK